MAVTESRMIFIVGYRSRPPAVLERDRGAVFVDLRVGHAEVTGSRPALEPR